MATSTEQINGLIAGYTDLKAFFEGERDEIAAARASALTDLNDRIDDQMSLTFYVDQGSGDDANAGTLEAPKASIDNAVSAAPQGGTVVVRLIGDYHLDRVVYIRNRIVRVISNDNSNPSTLTFAGVASNEANSTPCFEGSTNTNACVYLSSLIINLATADAGVTKKRLVGTFTFVTLFMNGCEIIVGAGSDQNIIESGEACAIIVKNMIYTGTIAGRWRGDIAGGTDPTTVKNIAFTNITSL